MTSFFFLRNRMLEEFYYKLPVGDDSEFDFMGFTREQILYMREHRTTALPPNMFKRFKSRASSDIDDDAEVNPDDERSDVDDNEPDKKKLKILEYEGFQLRNSFPQNIALMRDGSVVFCEDFVKPPGHAFPVIFGYRFQKVSIFKNKDFFQCSTWRVYSRRIIYFCSMWSAVQPIFRDRCGFTTCRLRFLHYLRCSMEWLF